MAFSTLSIFYGTGLTERLAKRHADAPLRALVANYLCGFPFLVASPLMPSAELSILCYGVSTMFQIAGAIPQNAALQIITPNAMRGQVTAIFLFMFTVVQGLGASVLTFIEGLLGGERHLGGAMAIMAAAIVPIATATIVRALRPYREAIAVG